MDLLLVTTRWPHGEVTEFLETEICSLAGQFDRVVVAPMRPGGTGMAALPDGVECDLSLARRIVRNPTQASREARLLAAAWHAPQPNPSGLGFSHLELARNWRDYRWVSHAVHGRADSRVVARWAAERRAPALAYTFWLGAATVGLRQAWPQVRLVSRVHGGDLFSQARGWQSIPFQRQAIAAADLVASVSDRGRSYLVAKFPEAGPRLQWRPLGVADIGGPAPITQDASLRLISVSAITANKRVHLIAEVATALAHAGHKVRWTHLGDGPDRDHVTRAMLAGPQSLHVHLPGHVSLPHVHRELLTGGHDVFINLSLSEGAPVSLMEAQCVGLPTVATSVGGTPEVVPAALNELQDPGDTVADFSAAVLRAASRPAAQRQERRLAWAARYDAAINYPQWACELAALAAGGGD